MKKCNTNHLLCIFSGNIKEIAVLLLCSIMKVNANGDVLLEIHLVIFFPLQIKIF